MLGNLLATIGISLMGVLGTFKNNTKQVERKSNSVLTTLNETTYNENNTYLLQAKNYESNGSGVYYESGQSITLTYSAEIGYSGYYSVDAQISINSNREYDMYRLGFGIQQHIEPLPQGGTSVTYRLYQVWLTELETNTAYNMYLAPSGSVGAFNRNFARFTLQNIASYSGNRTRLYDLINRFFDVYESKEIDTTDTNMYEQVEKKNVYTYLNGFYTMKTSSKQELLITPDTRAITSVISGINFNGSEEKELITTYLEVADTYKLGIYNNLITLKETDTSGQNAEKYSYLNNCIYIGNGRVNTNDLTNIEIYKVLNPKLIDSRFIDTKIVLNSQMNPYQKWGYDIKTDMFIPQDETLTTDNIIWDWYYKWFEGVAYVNNFYVKEIRNTYYDSYNRDYWLNGNTSSESMFMTFLRQNYMNFDCAYGVWEKRINGLTPGQTIIGLGTDINRPLISVMETAQAYEHTGYINATTNKTSEIYFAIMEDGYDLETIQLQYGNYYIVNENNGTGDSVFDLIAKGFKSWQVLFNLQVGTLSLGILFFAPLLIGFMIWLIHLVKRG